MAATTTDPDGRVISAASSAEDRGRSTLQDPEGPPPALAPAPISSVISACVFYSLFRSLVSVWYV